MEQIAQQLDNVRNEMVQLLYDYANAAEPHREYIYQRCELLGGEIQELVGLLKLAICQARHEAEAERDSDPDYATEITQMSAESLTAIHAAAQEVNSAIRMLRETRGEDPGPV